MSKVGPRLVRSACRDTMRRAGCGPLAASCSRACCFGHMRLNVLLDLHARGHNLRDVARLPAADS